MTERSILFSAPMVRALRAGTKTQTRRIVKPQPRDAPEGVNAGGAASPYGAPGARLWVRETFHAYGRWETRFNHNKGRDEWRFVDMTRECGYAYLYVADDPDVAVAASRSTAPGWHRRPAIFMPRAASRIVLEIVSVRVERLQDISVADALAEGIEASEGTSPVDSYRTLWGNINGVGSWDANPWVWVVEFG